MRTALAIAAAVLGAPAWLASAHLTVLTLGALLYRNPSEPKAPHVRFLVLIPAHNEQAVLGDTLTALRLAIGRREDVAVIVVADRCTDATADIARVHGAIVLERGPEEEPGRAAARQAGLDLGLTLPWDAVVMIDADSRVEAGFFEACEEMLVHAPALQARSEASTGASIAAQASVAAFAIQGVTIPRGRDRLGFSVRLRGTGIVLERWIIERFRFRAPASEDLVLTLDLCLDGIRPRHVDHARLRSESTSTWKGAGGQRVRWEAGRLNTAREFVRPLLKRGDSAALESATHLVTPPFALSIGLLVASLALAVGAGSTPILWISGAALALLALDLMVAMVMAKVGIRTWLALVAAPWYVVWKAWIQVRAIVGMRRAGTLHAPTTRGE